MDIPEVGLGAVWREPPVSLSIVKKPVYFIYVPERTL
jgi:hypothetical protein